mmetsp:Transcript_6468/g.11061  ORF Transcript_6468/g.11061 Transcript_6468/m.11061 type:complete len:211 (+) Transcript_6468:542-1174(+)
MDVRSTCRMVHGAKGVILWLEAFVDHFHLICRALRQGLEDFRLQIRADEVAVAEGELDALPKHVFAESCVRCWLRYRQSILGRKAAMAREFIDIPRLGALFVGILLVHTAGLAGKAAMALGMKVFSGDDQGTSSLGFLDGIDHLHQELFLNLGPAGLSKGALSEIPLHVDDHQCSLLVKKGQPLDQVGLTDGSRSSLQELIIIGVAAAIR